MHWANKLIYEPRGLLDKESLGRYVRMQVCCCVVCRVQREKECGGIDFEACHAASCSLAVGLSGELKIDSRLLCSSVSL